MAISVSNQMEILAKVLILQVSSNDDYIDNDVMVRS